MTLVTDYKQQDDIYLLRFFTCISDSIQDRLKYNKTW